MLDVDQVQLDVRGYLDAWRPRGFPVDPFQLASELGLRVYLDQLGDNVSGMLRKTPEGPAEIFIDVDDTVARQRFTCAHELGHLHQNRGRDIVAYVDYRSDQVGERERYANAFAAELLMPEDAVRFLLSQDASISEMAEIFDVSAAAMKHRREHVEKRVAQEKRR